MSNLCTEIGLPVSTLETFVCCLASANLALYDEWKATDLLWVIVCLLEAALTEYIEKTAGKTGFEYAHRFAKRHRALGIGVLGWHDLLQSKMIPVESMEAKHLNNEIWRLMKDKTYEASSILASIFGEPEVCKGYGRRHATLLAVAPTTSSSCILGQVSMGIEPHASNYYVKPLAKLRFTFKNKNLKKVLKAHNKDTPETWKSIMKTGGSVQHLKFLSDHEKAVFKTWDEISPMELVIQASQRQKFIDQAQSFNLLIHPETPAKQVSQLLIEGWRLGIKSFYYQRGANPSQKLARSILECANCES